MKRRIFFWVWLIALLILWEALPRGGLVNAHLLPPFSKVFVNLAKELFINNLGHKIARSLQIMSVGFALSFCIAIITVLLCIWIPITESLFTMLSTILSSLSSVALMPLIIMWFGIKTGVVFALIVHAVLWSLLRHLLDGMHTVSAVYKEWGININLPPWRMFTDIIFFAIMPELLAGVRIGWGRAWRALLSAEFIIGSVNGLGYYMNVARAQANIENVMAGIVVIIVVGILVEKIVFGQIEKNTIVKWGMAYV
jgi:NitT/TauT family transport system permease protein